MFAFMVGFIATGFLTLAALPLALSGVRWRTGRCGTDSPPPPGRIL